MARTDIGQIVSEAWDKAMNHPDPEKRIVAELKNGKRFYVWLGVMGRTLETFAIYRSGRTLRGLFDLSNTVLTDGAHDYPVYRQRPGRNQPRFDYPPSDWTSAPELMELLQTTQGPLRYATRPTMSLRELLNAPSPIFDKFLRS
jgi:hypothetical protein